MSTRGVRDPVTGITDGAMRTLLKSALRPIWRRTSRKEFINSIRFRQLNPKTGRDWYVLKCADCGRVMGCSEKARRLRADGVSLEKKYRSVFEINHKHMITPLTDIKETLGDFWYSLIYGEMEVLCVHCHKKETKRQNEEKKANKLVDSKPHN